MALKRVLPKRLITIYQVDLGWLCQFTFKWLIVTFFPVDFCQGFLSSYAELGLLLSCEINQTIVTNFILKSNEYLSLVLSHSLF